MSKSDFTLGMMLGIVHVILVAGNIAEEQFVDTVFDFITLACGPLSLTKFGH
jgi:hypothetical protein